jgi:hypothetical protein
VAGGSVFPKPWEGVVAAIALILVINQSISWFNERRAKAAAATQVTSSSADRTP